MKKTMKRIISLVLCTLMVMALCGCEYYACPKCHKTLDAPPSPEKTISTIWGQFIDVCDECWENNPNDRVTIIYN